MWKLRQITHVPAYIYLFSASDGRVKTLHPLIHAGLLSIRDNEDHQATIMEYDISQIDFAYCQSLSVRTDGRTEQII